MRQSLRRLLTLERLRRPARIMALWDDGTGKAQEEAAELERQHGTAVEVRLFAWLQPLADLAGETHNE